MDRNYAERFLLLQALIIRRVPENSRIAPQLLMEALVADNEVVLTGRPGLYFNGMKNISQEVDICLEEELIEDGLGRKIGRNAQAITLRRTKKGQMFLDSLGKDLADALDSMPMSDVGVLDFLSLL